ncbi:biliverdin-producing heme oxygenase [Rhodospirillum centenum]|nr:biliverdin-producing heme oxygenase [Rhodospirillum centenum]
MDSTMIEAGSTGPEATRTPPRKTDLPVRLRLATRDQHVALEAQVDPERRLRTLDGYLGWLGILLGFHRPLESVLGGLDWSETGLDFDQRRRTALLAADLEDLGLDPDSAPDCPDLPPVDGLARAFGALYVLEGSTLGGQVVVRQYGEVFGGLGGRAMRYYTSYGANIGRQWRAFQQALATACADPEAETACIAAAQETFDALHAWVARCDAAAPRPV